PACSHVCVRAKQHRSSPSRADRSRTTRLAPILAAAAALFSFVLTSNMIPGGCTHVTRLSPDPASPQLKTRLDAAVLGDLADTVELVVSELVTNAVQASADHDGRPRYSADTGLACVHLRLSTDGRAALVEVWDETAVPPTPVQPGLADEG